ncbi:hypothetical protein H2204_006216 [Knufia peltigerae]|uniref:Uncharacterized protein n=1 Tax=Knufia peltigerae TaxID=1002370 RepID=A0AA38Y478_9EURO|nr:hypothetical protein H2204_006216 [Knufia peltigerae]
MFEYLPGGVWLPLGDATGPTDVLKMLHLVSGRSAKFQLKGAWVTIRVIRDGNDIGTLDGASTASPYTTDAGHAHRPTVPPPPPLLPRSSPTAGDLSIGPRL